jgi:hypothetical protein
MGERPPTRAAMARAHRMKVVETQAHRMKVVETRARPMVVVSPAWLPCRRFHSLPYVWSEQTPLWSAIFTGLVL